MQRESKGLHMRSQKAGTVPRVRSVRQRMFHNLSRSAHSNIEPQLAPRASQLAPTVELQSKRAAAPAYSGRVTVTASAQAVAPPADTPVTRVSRIGRLVTATLGECVGRVSTFMKQNVFFLAAHGG